MKTINNFNKNQYKPIENDDQEIDETFRQS